MTMRDIASSSTQITGTGLAYSPTAFTVNVPCAACKYLRRKCQDCPFAPYFPPDQPDKFTKVHKIYGASNVAKLLKKLEPEQRQDAVTSLSYEAEMRIRDPIHGCTGVISVLQRQLMQIQNNLYRAKMELAQSQPGSSASFAQGVDGFANMVHSYPAEMGGYGYQQNHMMADFMAEQGVNVGYDTGVAAGVNASSSGPVSGSFIQVSQDGGDVKPGIGSPLKQA